METPEQYNLSWKNFRDCASNTFRELLKQQEFADVTLVCEDDKQLHAHKVILSACSPFFKKILLKNPHQHPLIYLTGVSRQYLSCMVSFMYLGQTNVAQEDLTGFMAAASKYQIKGLSEEKDKVSGVKRSQDSTSLPFVESLLEAHIEERSAAFTTSKTLKTETEFEENQATREEESFEPQMETFAEPVLDDTSGRRWETGVFDDTTNYESFRQFDDSFACDHCQFSTKNKSNLKAHRNAKHLGVKYPCDQCDYKASYSNHLRQHKRVKHEGVNFPCDQCSFQTSQKSKLKLHLREKHGRTFENITNPTSQDCSLVTKIPSSSTSVILHKDLDLPTGAIVRNIAETISVDAADGQDDGVQNDQNMSCTPTLQYLTAQLQNLVSQGASGLGPGDQNIV